MSIKKLEPKLEVNYPSDFGIFIRNERKHLKLPQSDFARIVGVSAQTVCAWEGGHTRCPTLTITQIKNICRLTGRLLSEIPNGEEDVIYTDYEN